MRMYGSGVCACCRARGRGNLGVVSELKATSKPLSHAARLLCIATLLLLLLLLLLLSTQRHGLRASQSAALHRAPDSAVKPTLAALAICQRIAHHEQSG